MLVLVRDARVDLGAAEGVGLADVIGGEEGVVHGIGHISHVDRLHPVGNSIGGSTRSSHRGCAAAPQESMAAERDKRGISQGGEGRLTCLRLRR